MYFRLPAASRPLLLFCSLLAGCRSEQVAFRFRPGPAGATAPATAAHSPASQLPKPTPTASLPTATVLPDVRPPHQQAVSPSPQKAVALLPVTRTARRLPAAAARLVRRPASEAAAALTTTKLQKAGLVFLGFGVLLLVLVLVLVLAPGTFTLAGAIMLYMGYLFGIAMLVVGLVLLLISLLSA
ncbi:hypothetical protein [Hymenobacter canadensis]|uniref:Uncharacterized protein n=1 Tax=Hymenobacter canadensis TaxID=2999067 RepID=A0ABY7LMU2_9BACT|nr:hypothetical protein [Hymenobacter canadensis]WBA40914.1 hypothetical protein O3303_13910 [Hymenobacter canadensis]